MLYHYTFSESLTNILQADGIHLWFSRFDCLNDITEGKIAKHIQVQEEVCINLKKVYPEKVNLLNKIAQIEPDYKSFFITFEEQYTRLKQPSATATIYDKIDKTVWEGVY